MVEWKNGMTTQQVARKMLRSHLVRCHRSISKNYPEIVDMPPEQSADYLLHLKDTGKIEIELYNKTDVLIGCRITDIDPELSENK